MWWIYDNDSAISFQHDDIAVYKAVAFIYVATFAAVKNTRHNDKMSLKTT